MARTRAYSTIFKGLAGLNNKLQPMRAPYDRELGIQAVTASENFIFDDSGAARVRSGFVPITDMPWTSTFSHEGVALGVSAGALWRMFLDGDTFAAQELVAGIRPRVGYARVNDAIYFVAGPVNGRIVDGKYFPWNDIGGYGRATDRVFSAPPAADHIAFHLGRIWLGNKDGVFFSEPLGFGLFDLHANALPTDAPVTMLCAVQGGIFISTTKKVYFLGGSTPNEFQLIEKTGAAPAKEWSVLPHLVPARKLGYDVSGEVALWVGTDGVYAGLPDGNISNLTFENVAFPETLPFGASVVFEDQFMFCLGA